MRDIRDADEAEMRERYREYLASLGRAVPTVHHRQGRVIPNAIAPISDSLMAITRHSILVVNSEVKAGELG
jgi:hypothetical protein